MFSAVKAEDHIILSMNVDNIYKMASYVAGTSVDRQLLFKMIVPKNLDIICFVNDLAIKRKIGPKYVIQGEFDTYHPDDYIYHQCKFIGSNTELCNVVIKDTYDESLMDGGEACPGTLALSSFYKNAYNQVSSEILNKNSLFVRGNAGIYSILERNLAEFVTYLSWSKTNEVLRYVRSFNTTKNFDLASSFELVERTDGVMFDIVRKLKESKDTSFYMIDERTGNKIKMQVEGAIPSGEGGLTADFYHQEFLNNLAAYRNGTVNTITAAIKSADDRIKKSMSIGIRTGISMAASLSRQGWTLEVIDGVDYFVYHNKIYANSVVGSATGDRNKRYLFPKECENLIYLYDVTVPIDTVLRSGISVSDPTKGVRAKGFNPHRSSNAGDIYDELKHTSELGKVCIGDLDGKPFEKIVNLVDALSIVYQPSMMGNLASRCVSCMFGQDISVMSTSTTKVNIEKSKEYIKPFTDNKGVFLKPAPKVAKDKDKDKKDPEEPVMASRSEVRSGAIFSVE